MAYRAGLVLAVVATLLANSSAWADEDNPLYDQVVDAGVDFGGKQIPLPKPTLADGLSAAEQQQVLVELTKAGPALDEFTRQAVVAPFKLVIGDTEGGAGTVPKRVDLWFVVYADLAQVHEDTFLQNQGGGASTGKDQGRILTDADLKKRSVPSDPLERYLAADFALFDRVRLSGVMRARLTHNADSAVLAAVLDPRFASDEEFPNQWRPLKRDDSGTLAPGTPMPYTEAAWYCKATKLSEPAGALLVEYHLVFDEPHGWFNGANLLRSKLPIVVQDGVRKFRRRLQDKSAGK